MDRFPPPRKPTDDELWQERDQERRQKEVDKDMDVLEAALVALRNAADEFKRRAEMVGSKVAIALAKDLLEEIESAGPMCRFDLANIHGVKQDDA